MEDLKYIKRLIRELNRTNSSNEKKKILKNHSECKKILRYTYDPFKQYYVTSTNLKKMAHLDQPVKRYHDFYQLLDDLDARKISGHEAIATVNGFIKDNPAYADEILRVIDRNLKTRTDAKLINKVWPSTVPSFDVALAQKYEDYENKIDFKKQNWLASRKLDGCVSGSSIVELEDGSHITIRELVENRVDKKIKSYNEKSKKIEFKKITAYIKNGKDVNEKEYKWYAIELENGVTLKLTGNHRVYLPDLKCYRRVDELDGNEYLLLDIGYKEGGPKLHIEKVKIKSINEIDSEDRYDLEVESNNNYFVNGILTHNCRVITIIDSNGDIKFYSRKGKEFTTLDKVKEAIKKQLNQKIQGGLVLDGEMCIVDKDGNEDFTSMIKLIRRKDFTVPNPKYKIFDMMLQEVFEGTADPKLNTKFSSRIKAIDAMKSQGIFDGNILDPVEQIPIESKEHLIKMTKEAVDSGWEGLIIRHDVLYEGKRTNNMLKVKKFHDAEYIVKDAVMGPIRFIDNGKEKEEEMLSAIEIEHKGYKVSVGSGFSIDQRRYYYKHPEELISSEVTIVYFEETTNKQNTISLRFPTVKAIYGKDGRQC